MTWLLDGNVLAALAITSHEHHARAHDWFASIQSFATCAVTQGTLLRVHMIMAEDHSAVAAWETLRRIEAMLEHEFWPDSFSYSQVEPRFLQSPKQVTDAWLVELARRRESRLATFDGALVALHKAFAFFIPV